MTNCKKTLYTTFIISLTIATAIPNFSFAAPPIKEILKSCHQYLDSIIRLSKITYYTYPFRNAINFGVKNTSETNDFSDLLSLKVRHSNCEISDATIIAIGESHGDMAIQADQRAILQELFKPGDVILVEGIDSLQIADNSAFIQTLGKKNIQPNDVRVLGWDNVDLLQQAHAAKEDLIQEKNRLHNLNELNMSKSVEEKMKNSTSIKTEISKLNAKYQDITFNQRNAIMIQTVEVIKKTLAPENRIFIIAGNDHFHHEKAKNVLNFLNKSPFISFEPKFFSQRR
jgi:hypothetical protein